MLCNNSLYCKKPMSKIGIAGGGGVFSHSSDYGKNWWNRIHILWQDEKILNKIFLCLFVKWTPSLTWLLPTTDLFSVPTGVPFLEYRQNHSMQPLSLALISHRMNLRFIHVVWTNSLILFIDGNSPLKWYINTPVYLFTRWRIVEWFLIFGGYE